MYALVIRNEQHSSPHLVLGITDTTYRNIENTITSTFPSATNFTSWGNFQADDPDYPGERANFTYDALPIQKTT